MALTLAGMLISVVSAAAIVRQKLATVIDQLADTEVRLRGLDRRIDALDTRTEKQEQRLNILAQMSSPENLRRDHMAMATLVRDCNQLRKEMDHQLHIHNSKHIPVPDVRRAE